MSTVVRVSDAERNRTVSRVMRTVARMGARGPLPVSTADGVSAIVVALPSDRIADVEDRRIRIGGKVNLFVAYTDRLVLLAMNDLEDDDDTIPVSPDSDMDMLVTWLKSTATQSGSIRLTAAKHAMPSIPVVQEFSYAF